MRFSTIYVSAGVADAFLCFSFDPLLISYLNLLVVMNEFHLHLRQMSDVVANGVQIRLPVGEERVEVGPVLLGECPVHG